MFSELFKSICHDQPKRIIRPVFIESQQEYYSIERISPYQARALKNYRAERERFEQEREQREHEELMLFVRLVNEWNAERKR